MTINCIFCTFSNHAILAENALAKAFYDKYPVNEGHALIVPKRHAETFFDATLDEIMAINELVSVVKGVLDARFNPDGYNIGVNVGQAAGQTVFHLHVHVIPRYHGDVDNPQGGIRLIKKAIVPYVPGEYIT